MQLNRIQDISISKTLAKALSVQCDTFDVCTLLLPNSTGTKQEHDATSTLRQYLHLREERLVAVGFRKYRFCVYKYVCK